MNYFKSPPPPLKKYKPKKKRKSKDNRYKAKAGQIPASPDDVITSSQEQQSALQDEKSAGITMPIPATEMVKLQYSSFDNNMMLRKMNNGQNNLINCELLIN